MSSLLGQELGRDMEQYMQRPNEVYLLSLCGYRDHQHLAVYYNIKIAEQDIEQFIVEKERVYGRTLDVRKIYDCSDNNVIVICSFKTDNIPHNINSGRKLWILKLIHLPAI